MCVASMAQPMAKEPRRQRGRAANMKRIPDGSMETRGRRCLLSNVKIGEKRKTGKVFLPMKRKSVRVFPCRCLVSSIPVQMTE